MRRIRKSKKAAFIVIALLLLISIGYAALTTNLTIGGSATVKNQTFNVYFNNVQVNQSSVSGAKVTTAPSVPANSTSTTTLTWAVTLDTPGEFYEFNVDIVNGGSMDAMVNTATNNIVATLTQAQQAYLDYTVTYVNGAAIERYDKLEVGETKTITVRLEFKQDVNPGDLPTEGASGISLSFSSDYVPADGNAVTKVTTVQPLEIGSSVNYSTSLNGVNLTAWRVFYIDGDYTYIILDGELPATAISNTLKTNYSLATDGAYTVYQSNDNAATMVSAMTTKSNWDELLTGTLNGNAVTFERTENVYAMGSPTLSLWTSSWNTVYPEHPATSYYELYSEGISNTLYFTHIIPEGTMYDDIKNSQSGGYWLATNEWDEERVNFVDYFEDCRVDYFYPYSNGKAFRPIIRLQTSDLN